MKEIALLQILMKRVFIGMQADIPLSDYLRAGQTLSYADSCLAKLNSIRGIRFNVYAVMEEAWQEVRIEMVFRIAILPELFLIRSSKTNTCTLTTK